MVGGAGGGSSWSLLALVCPRIPMVLWEEPAFERGISPFPACSRTLCTLFPPCSSSPSPWSLHRGYNRIQTLTELHGVALGLLPDVCPCRVLGAGACSILACLASPHPLAEPHSPFRGSSFTAGSSQGAAGFNHTHSRRWGKDNYRLMV